jgi:hypothetical protein
MGGSFDRTARELVDGSGPCEKAAYTGVKPDQQRHGVHRSSLLPISVSCGTRVGLNQPGAIVPSGRAQIVKQMFFSFMPNLLRHVNYQIDPF